jgi:hypothetical protein
MSKINGFVQTELSDKNKAAAAAGNGNGYGQPIGSGDFSAPRPGASGVKSNAFDGVQNDDHLMPNRNPPAEEKKRYIPRGAARKDSYGRIIGNIFGERSRFDK